MLCSICPEEMPSPLPLTPPTPLPPLKIISQAISSNWAPLGTNTAFGLFTVAARSTTYQSFFLQMLEYVFFQPNLSTVRVLQYIKQCCWWIKLLFIINEPIPAVVCCITWPALVPPLPPGSRSALSVRFSSEN